MSTPTRWCVAFIPLLTLALLSRRASADDFEITHQGKQAPCIVHVNALNLTPPGGAMTATYAWDFGDRDGRRNTLPGWVAAHLYEKPGNYTIRLTLTASDGTKIVSTRQVLVRPDGRKKICIAPDGVDGNPGTPQRPLPPKWVLAQLRSNTELLLKRGEQYEFSAKLHLAADDLVIGAWGDETLPKPVLREVVLPGTNGSSIFDYDHAKARNIIIRDVRLDSTWKPDAKDESRHADAYTAVIRGHNGAFIDTEADTISQYLVLSPQTDGFFAIGNKAVNPMGLDGHTVWAEGNDIVILDTIGINSNKENIFRIAGDGVTRGLFAFNDCRRLSPWKADYSLRTMHWAYFYGNRATDAEFGAGVRTKERIVEHCVFEANEITNSTFVLNIGVHDIEVRNNKVYNEKDPPFRVSFKIEDKDHEGLTLTDVRIHDNEAITKSDKPFLRLFGNDHPAPEEVQAWNNKLTNPMGESTFSLNRQ